MLTLGFATTVAMWATGYVCRLPGLVAPGWLVFALLLAIALVGGFMAGRLSGRGAIGGLQVGLVTGVLNLLVLGSLLGGGMPSEAVRTALLWVPVSVLATGLCMWGAAVAGRAASRGARTPDVNWPAAFAGVAVVATLLLLSLGGAVTGFQAGLAVPDWPNSYGYNMFLYPLAKMTGGIYYEHAHRLFGSLVGLTTVVLALYVLRVDSRAWVRLLGGVAVVAVVVQGLMGGLRVTGEFTLESDPARITPNDTLAIVHGVFAQLFFTLLVLLGAMLTRRWQEGVPATRPGLQESGAIAPSGRFGGERDGGSAEAATVPAERFRTAPASGVEDGAVSSTGAHGETLAYARPRRGSGQNRELKLIAASATDRGLGAFAVGVVFVQIVLGALVRHSTDNVWLFLHVGFVVAVLGVVGGFGVRSWGIYENLRSIERGGALLLLVLLVQLILGGAALGVRMMGAAQGGIPVLITTLHQTTGAVMLATTATVLLWHWRLIAALPAGASDERDERGGALQEGGSSVQKVT